MRRTPLTRQEARDIANQERRLLALGITLDHAEQLRRISMTLRGWFEKECGNSNQDGSWAIERDEDGDGAPYLVHHHYRHGAGPDTVTRTRIADREAGARRRLAAILAQYPHLTAYVQTDPRGCALYILTADQLDPLHAHAIDAIYTRGVAVA
jgi:hypothetical protein